MSDWPKSVTKKDLNITYYRGSGPGGQHRNKKDTACRMKHIPTGITTQSQEHKSREQNKKAAFKRLAEQLIPIMKNEIEKPRFAVEDKRIRTYNDKTQRVTDTRLPGVVFNYIEVVNGDGLEKIIDRLTNLNSEEM